MCYCVTVPVTLTISIFVRFRSCTDSNPRSYRPSHSNPLVVPLSVLDVLPNCTYANTCTVAVIVIAAIYAPAGLR